ncbi:hypothetical protein D3C81_1669370 [compost metagenome]
MKLLPALPESWNEGRVSGLRARGGFIVDMEWSGGRLIRAVLVSTHGYPCSLSSSLPLTVQKPDGTLADAGVAFETIAGETYILIPQHTKN